MLKFDSRPARRSPGRVGAGFRVLSALMAALFTLALIVQFNDPDPARWVLVYGSAAVLTALLAADRRVPVWAAAALSLVAVIWGTRLAAIGAVVAPGELFQHWEMKDERIEIAREAGGLFIIAIWMGITIAEFVRHRRTRDRPRRILNRGNSRPVTTKFMHRHKSYRLAAGPTDARAKTARKATERMSP